MRNTIPFLFALSRRRDESTINPVRLMASFCLLGDEVVSAIYSLLSGCRPAAILRSVITVVINALKCHPRRALSHISEEITEAINPSRADVYPSSGVPHVVISRAQVTAILHIPPRRVFKRSTHAVVGLTVMRLKESLRNSVFVQICLFPTSALTPAGRRV